jgi:hypothetical protein
MIALVTCQAAFTDAQRAARVTPGDFRWRPVPRGSGRTAPI